MLQQFEFWQKFRNGYFFHHFVYCFIIITGEFVDDYTVRVIDVFAMPQTGTGVSVEAVDPVFQAKMLDMLKQTGRPEMVVGMYSYILFKCSKKYII